jgi:drug/metabolite transporter (DMT)-like permease
VSGALWGLLCALSFGIADLIAGRSGRAIGAKNALLATFVVGALLLSLWLAVVPPATDWPRQSLWLLGGHGLATTVAILLLYWGLARGPMSVVAPIVAVHPALVVAWLYLAGEAPTALQWLAMAAAILGAVVVGAAGERAAGRDRRHLAGSIAVAVVACLAYAVWAVIGQAAGRAYGPDAALWATRLVSLGSILVLFALARERPRLPRPWWPWLAAQGVLDSAGIFFFYGGGRTEDPAVAAVVASTFGAVTTLLAWALFRERVIALQWAGIVLVFASVAVLAGQG